MIRFAFMEGMSALRTVRGRQGVPWALAGLLAGGCLAPTGGAGGGHWQPTSDDEAFMDSFYAAIQPCCALNDYDPSQRVDEWRSLLASAGFTRDQSLRSACIAEVQNLAGPANCLPMSDDVNDPCTRTFSEPSGPDTPGETCSNSADCAGSPGTTTDCFPFDSSSDLSRCTTFAYGKLGSSPCSGQTLSSGLLIIATDGSVPAQGFVCQEHDGLYCDPSSRSCAVLLPAGSSCATSDACASKLCVAGQNTCAPTASVGDGCAQAVCDQTTYCDSVTKTCVAKSPDGAFCGQYDQCTGTCNGSTCSPVTNEEAVVLEGWCL